MTTSNFATFVAPARARPELWRLLAGGALTVLLYVGMIVGTAVLVAALLGEQGGIRWFELTASGRTPGGVVLLLLSFAGMAAGPILAARWLHRRPARTLFGPLHRLRRDFAVTAALILLAWLALFALVFAFQNPDRQTPAGTWALWLPLALVGLLIQTGAEEMLFRGYLQQQLAARFRSPLAWMVLPSLLFGLLHLDTGTFGGDAWMVVAATGLFGLIAADLTARTGSLGAAWGLHFSNNLFAILVLTTEGTLDGLALFSLPLDDGNGLRAYLLLDMIALVGLWALCRRVLRV